ncbi:hypothetical protein DH2020_027037 [Rehmannia glutinosa]|uniref:HD domain-containing protein n=1 Tax=Rehmannia glutinosa TaxID=99300 RepID=A0ABR0VV78_REHGL
MGAKYFGEEFPSNNFVLSSTDERRFTKHIHDNVHGNIYLDPLSLKFVDTEQFQRLRDLKQLGLSYMVYPGAVHSRFEHSLGVYWLASEAINRLKNYQGLELDIDRFDTQTVKIAGLLHDIGHGPFSHMFEREFLPRVLHGLKWSHEEMSLKMIDYVVDEHSIDIDSESLKKVKELIIASENGASKTFKEKLFLYDIVANGRNGIDVDKFDYIVRDSRACGLGCNFQFQSTFYSVVSFELGGNNLTMSPFQAIELMFVDAITKANDVLHISSYIDEPAQYWKLDDTILKTIETSSCQDLKESRDLVLRIRRRDLYQFCNEFAVPKENLVHFKKVTPQDIVCSQNSRHPTLHEEDIAVSNVRIDLTRGRNNPLESISFFKDYDSSEKFTIKDDLVSHLLPTSYQDMIVRVYSKKPHLVEAVSEAFENFQLKSYGMKTQVHATPEKKKRKQLRYNSTGDDNSHLGTERVYMPLIPEKHNAFYL